MFTHVQVVILAISTAFSIGRTLLRLSSLDVLTDIKHPAVAQLPADCTRNYTVQIGDFCDGISAAQNAST